MADLKYTPWPEDEIVFKRGNWSVERAETPGLYAYSVGDIRSYAEVDAVQLVEWGMAEAIRYTALTPWEGSGIEFTGKAEILRDLADRTKQLAARCYYLETPTPAGRSLRLQRVNRYYLVENGYAVATDAFKRHVAELSLKKAPSIDSWAQDEIIITPKDGWTVEKGIYIGLYRVGKNGVKYNWDARRLLDEGLAVSAYEKKLSEHAKATNVRMSELKERFHGLWMAENAGEVSTVHEIALLWRELEENPNCRMLSAIYAHNQRICDAYMNVEAQRTNLILKLEEVKTKLRSLEEASKGAKRLSGQYSAYSSITPAELNDEVTRVRENLRATLTQVRVLAGDVSALLDSIETVGRSIKMPAIEKPFPIGALPVPLTREMQAARSQQENLYSRIDTYEEFYKTLTSFVPDTTAWHPRLQQVKTDLEAYEMQEKRTSEIVEGVRKRKAELDAIKGKLGPKYRSHRVPLFQRPWKEDRIRYTTSVKIKRYRSGIYVVPIMGNDHFLTAESLIYLGLAKRK